MRKRSVKTQKFLEAVKLNPHLSLSYLAKQYKIAVGHAYRLGKEVRPGKEPKALPAQAIVPVVTSMATVTIKDANAEQVGGDHYRKNAIQPWDYIVSNRLGYLEGNIVKYVSRWRDKGGRQDLEKARHYLDKLLEVA